MRTPLRIVLVLLPLLALVWAIVEFVGARSARAELASAAGPFGSLDPELARRVESEIDAEVAAVIVARSAVAAYLDPERRLAAAAGATQESTLDPLLQAREISRDALANRPTQWQASMLLGATTYLIRLQKRDTRLFSHARDWEAPLERAHELAPGQVEPRRFLAAAYLDTWPALSPRKREITRQILADILDDRESFRLLVGTWLQISSQLSPQISAETGADDDEALALIPDHPWAWSHLLSEFAAEHEWGRYAVARERWHRALGDSLRASIVEASERLEGGDVQGARTLLTSVVHQTPLGNEYAELFTDALRRLPPGPVAAVAERQLRRWHDWTLRLCTTVGCPVAPAVVDRLAGAIRDALPHEAAIAALAAGDRAAAEAIERRNSVELEEIWSDYLLYKGAWLLEKNEPAAAAAALAATAHGVRATARYAELARRLDDLGVAGVITATNPAAESWNAAAWREHRNTFALELRPSRPAHGFALEIPALAPGGAVNVRWDGDRLGTFISGSGQAIEIEIEITPELHVLEIAPITGARPRPGPVQLLD